MPSSSRCRRGRPSRLITGLRVPERHAPILNLHFARAGAGPVRFLGVLGGLVQWVLVRPSGISVTVSAADAEADEAVETLAPRAWAEIRAAAARLRAAGRLARDAAALPGGEGTPRDAAPCAWACRRSRRASRCATWRWPGDWTWPGLPATIEAAALSGEAAATAIDRQMKRRRVA